MVRKRALFLDRDGVINIDTGYVHKVEDFIFIDGIFDLVRSADRLGYLIVVVTNQSGIGRGYFSEEVFLEFTRWMCDQFADIAAPITEVFYCPFHPEHAVAEYRKDSYERKPYPGMFLRAAEKYDLDLHNCIMVGDRGSDMRAAESAGIKTRIHYLDKVREGVASPHATKVVSSLQAVTDLLHELSAP
jgi:D-glycero-D-manno-heptose 1,7-bisphosphate phosphatase